MPYYWHEQGCPKPIYASEAFLVYVVSGKQVAVNYVPFVSPAGVASGTRESRVGVLHECRLVFAKPFQHLAFRLSARLH